MTNLPGLPGHKLSDSFTGLFCAQVFICTAVTSSVSLFIMWTLIGTKFHKDFRLRINYSSIVLC